MDRGVMQTVMEELKKIEIALEALSYRDAQKAIKSVEDVREMVGDLLPGGYYGNCPTCDEIKGNDEMVAGDDENVCAVCVASWNEPVVAKSA